MGPISDLFYRTQKDHDENFVPKQKIGEWLSFDQIKALLQSDYIKGLSSLDSHFRFYLKQLFAYSLEVIKKLDENTHRPLADMLLELKEMATTYGMSDNGRAIVMFLRLRLGLEDVSTYELVSIISGTVLYDHYCMHVAYEEFRRREEHSVKK